MKKIAYYLSVAALVGLGAPIALLGLIWGFVVKSFMTGYNKA
jgi:hypothetical protein